MKLILPFLLMHVEKLIVREHVNITKYFKFFITAVTENFHSNDWLNQ